MSDSREELADETRRYLSELIKGIESSEDIESEIKSILGQLDELSSGDEK